MDPKTLTESGWKTIAGKHKVKDNGLQRALAAYENADEDDHTAQLADIAKVNQLAGALQRNNDIAGNDAVMEYLDDLQAAADARQKEISKARIAADKAETAAEKQEKQEDAYEAKLCAALQKLKSSKGLSYEFLLCDAPDACAVVLAPRIAGPHKQQLTQLTGGRRFFGPGSCRFENGKYVFATDRPASGLAKKLQAALFTYTGRRLPVAIGGETEDGEA
jgi:hypothetical protein